MEKLLTIVGMGGSKAPAKAPAETPAKAEAGKVSPERKNAILGEALRVFRDPKAPPKSRRRAAELLGLQLPDTAPAAPRPSTLPPSPPPAAPDPDVLKLMLQYGVRPQR